MLLYSSFKNYFSSLAEVNDCAKRNMTGFAKIMDPEILIQPIKTTSQMTKTLFLAVQTIFTRSKSFIALAI